MLKKVLVSAWTWLFLTLVAIALVSILSPEERTLGANVRIVYMHGAWVWTALAGLLAAGLTGLIGLLTRQGAFHCWSRALGRTGMLFWITYLPLSLWAMQANWNGLFLAEPRWRLALVFSIAGLLLQTGLALLDKPVWTSLGNLAFILVLLLALTNTANVMHPPSPILSSDVLLIRFYFFALLSVTLLAGWQVARFIKRLTCQTQNN